MGRIKGQPRTSNRFGRADLKYGLDEISKIPASEISAYRRSLAKRANQRIVDFVKKEGYKYGESAVSLVAYPYLTRMGRRRFDEGLKAKPFGQEEREIAALTRFLQAKTSTVAGLKAVATAKRKNLADQLGITPGEAGSMLDTAETLFLDLMRVGFSSDEASFWASSWVANGRQDEQLKAIYRMIDKAQSNDIAKELMYKRIYGRDYGDSYAHMHRVKRDRDNFFD